MTATRAGGNKELGEFTAAELEMLAGGPLFHFPTVQCMGDRCHLSPVFIHLCTRVRVHSWVNTIDRWERTVAGVCKCRP